MANYTQAQRDEYEAICAAYAAQGKEACWGKGGVWVTGESPAFRPLRQARKETGIDRSVKRGPRQVVRAYGDWAFVAAINGVKL